MWKSYPHFLWITHQSLPTLWKMWKSYPLKMWITLQHMISVENVEKLSTTIVDKPEMLLALWINFLP
jgi:hypothetical protein